MTKDSVTIEKATLWKIATGILLVLVFVLLFRNNTAAAPATGQQPQVKADMTLFADDVVRGDKDAKVTIIEYSDPSSPFCAAAAGATEMTAYMQSRDPSWVPTLPGIFKDYVDTGKVKFVFRYYPGHGKGTDAMKILFCANEQDKFWVLHDVFFDNQAMMEAGNVAGLKQLAVQNGVDSAKLEACLTSKKYDSKLQTDVQRGQASGVQGTPGFFVNGVSVSGAVSYTDIKQVIEAQL